MKLTAVVICRNDPRHIYFANEVEKYINVKSLVVQPYDSFRKSIFKNSNVVKFFNFLWSQFIQIIQRRIKKEKQFFFGNSASSFIHTKNKIMTSKINNDIIVSKIKETKPDLILTFGCEILKKEDFFNISKYGIINLHSGIVPDYRGVDNVYWCIYNKEFEKIGATIHFINKGIDKGNYLAHAYPSIIEEESVNTLFNKTIKIGIKALCSMLVSIDFSQKQLGAKQERNGILYQIKDRNIISDIIVFKNLFILKNLLIRKKSKINYYFERKD